MLRRMSCGKLIAFGILSWTVVGRPTEVAAARERDNGANNPVALILADLFVPSVEGVMVPDEVGVYVKCKRREMRSIASSRLARVQKTSLRAGLLLISRSIPSGRENVRCNGLTDLMVEIGMRYLMSAGHKVLPQKQTKCWDTTR